MMNTPFLKTCIQWIWNWTLWFQKKWTSQSFLETLFLVNYKKNEIITEPVVYTESVPDYCARQIQRFQSFLNKDKKMINENMSAIFYDPSLFAKVNLDHELYRIMNTRILMEKTPMGNIIMSFDATKLCFTYYSDQHIASYAFLNAVAMKYCSMFRLVDLFVDEFYHVSPLLNILKEYYYADNILSERVVEKIEDPDYEIIKQNANLFRTGKSKSEAEQAKKRGMEEKMRNKFVYLGRLRDFHPLQTPNHSLESIQRLLFADSKPNGGGMFDGGKSLDWKSFKERKKV